MSFPDDRPPTFSQETWAKALAQFRSDYPGLDWESIPYTIRCGYAEQFSYLATQEQLQEAAGD